MVYDDVSGSKKHGGWSKKKRLDTSSQASEKQRKEYYGPRQTVLFTPQNRLLPETKKE